MSQTLELFSPELSVSVGGYTFSKGIEIESYSAKASYFDWSKIRFTEEFQPKVSFNAGETAEITLGYNGELEAVFQGYVSKGYNAGSSLNEILLKDDMLRLERTNITETFLNATPQEIISFALSKAGISSFTLSQSVYPAKDFPVSKKSVVALLQEINSVWGISIKFFFRGGKFYWGATPAQKSIYEFSYAQNIIDLNRVSGVWKLVTVSVPFIHHSDIIRVNHPSVTGEFEVSKVVFTTDTTGFIRTYLYFL